MPAVELDDSEWQAVIAMIATAPWRDANPLLMKISEQLRKRQEATKPDVAKLRDRRDG